MRWLALVAALAGCDTVLRLDTLHPPVCKPAIAGDDFSSVTPVCGTWGTLGGSDPAGLSRQPGELVIAFGTTAGVYADCVASRFTLLDNTVFATVGEVANNGGYGTLELYTYSSASAANPDAVTALAFAFGSIQLNDELANTTLATDVYSPTEMKWLRLGPIGGGMQLVADYSADGRAWKTLATRTLPAVANVGELVIGGGTSKTVRGDTGRTVYTSFDICP